MGNRLDCKCAKCGHVWTLVYLPLDASLLNKFAKTPCPKCHAPKPLMAGKDDLTAEDRLIALLRRCHDAFTRAETQTITDADWDYLRADLAKEVGLA